MIRKPDFVNTKHPPVPVRGERFDTVWQFVGFCVEELLECGEHLAVETQDVIRSLVEGPELLKEMRHVLGLGCDVPAIRIDHVVDEVGHVRALEVVRLDQAPEQVVTVLPLRRVKVAVVGGAFPGRVKQQ